MAGFLTNTQVLERTLIAGLCLLFALPLSAQDKINKKAQKLYDESTELLHWDKYKEATPLLVEALDIQPEFLKARERLGFIYYQDKQYADAFTQIELLVKQSPTYSKEAYYYLAMTGLATLQTDKAKEYLAHYKKVGAIGDKRAHELKLLERNISFAGKAKNDPIPFEPIDVGPGINTTDNEYFPALTAEGEYLYFTRQKQFGIKSQEDILVSQWSDDKWQSSLSVSNNVNTEAANEGAHSISPDGNALYFTMCEGQGGYGSCDIYVSFRKGGNWSKPKNLGASINTKYKETQPCISPDGRQLYFVSSRPGGIGKLDIWVSDLQPNGLWGEPINLGPTINTTEIDERPYIHTDNTTLYFSSDGHPGFGAADIYVSRLQANNTWGQAINLGYPLNSYSYEGGIFVSRDGSTAYFATDRFSEAGDLDIYSFPLPPSIQPIPATFVKGKVADNTNNRPLEAIITFTDIKTDRVISNTKTSELGDYFITLPTGSSYALNISKPGYLFFSKYFSLDSIHANKPYLLDVQLKAIEVGESLVLNNIFYTKGSYELIPGSKAELDDLVEMLQLNPTMSLEISGHTDNTGTDAINKELSQKRANAVMQYLVDNGIEAERLKAKGYGSSKPVADNNTDLGRSLNRRTEIQVTGK